MDGTTQARRNASDLVTARLVARAVLRRSGGIWDEHPLSEWPKAIHVSQATGKPVFLYGEPGALRTFEVRPGKPVEWKTDAPPILVETFLSAEVIEAAAYSETGELLRDAFAVVGDT